MGLHRQTGVGAGKRGPVHNSTHTQTHTHTPSLLDPLELFPFSGHPPVGCAKWQRGLLFKDIYLRELVSESELRAMILLN